MDALIIRVLLKRSIFKFPKGHLIDVVVERNSTTLLKVRHIQKVILMKYEII